MSADDDAVTEPGWDELRIGQRVGPLTHQIQPGMVQAFCQAMPFAPAAYAEGATYKRAIMPPTMLATDYVPLLHKQLALGWGLMARHAIKSLKPVHVGDTVTVSGEIVEKFERKGRHYWTLAYQVTSAQGERCIESSITCSVD